MFKWLSKVLFGRVDPVPAEVMQKIETGTIKAAEEVKAAAAPAKCGCGRSPTGNCVGLHKLSETEWAVHPDNPASFAKAETETVLSIEQLQAPAAAPILADTQPAQKTTKVRKPKVKVAAAVTEPVAEPKAKKPRAKKAK